MTVTDLVVGVDLGGTKTSAALVGPDGGIRRRVTTATPGDRGPAAIVDALVALIDELTPYGQPRAIGIGSAGVIDPVRGVVVSATDVLRDWAGTPLRDLVAERTGLPVQVDNDVHTHALGECWVGPSRDAGSLLLVAVGTGVGASYVVAGRVHHGARNVAGHLGHIPSPLAGDRPCVCGARGHLEAVAAGPAICAEATRRTGVPFDRLQDVASAADAGSVWAQEAIRDGAAALGAAIGGAVNLLDPDVVVVTGGVTGAGERWWVPMERAVRSQLLPAVADVPVRRSELGADGALLGAARLVLDVPDRTLGVPS